MACATVRDLQDVESLWSCFDKAFSKDAIAAQLRLHKGSLELASDALVNMAGFVEPPPAPVALPDSLDASKPVVTVNGPTQARARTPQRTVTNAHAHAHADACHTHAHAHPRPEAQTYQTITACAASGEASNHSDEVATPPPQGASDQGDQDVPPPG